MDHHNRLTSRTTVSRLYFIDAMRAVAILMMLQGHFIYGLLDEAYRDPNNFWYATWLYGRGITAPLFFTVSGFIFVYLLLRKEVPRALENPRLKKGVRRGLQLIAIGYLLRLNLFSLFSGRINPGFWMVDVLQCIGVGLLFLVLVYVLTYRRKGEFMMLTLASTGLALFLFQPVYSDWSFIHWPAFLANYFTRSNGSVFTLIPWLGYSAWGGFLALIFVRLKPGEKGLYGMALAFLLFGVLLTGESSALLMWVYRQTGWDLFKSVAYNNFLFIRFGNVLVLFAIFICLRFWLQRKWIVDIGQRTLGIYVLHFVLLYGSWLGLGLDRFFYRSLSPLAALAGALLFMTGITITVLLWYHFRPFEGLGGRISLTLRSALEPVRGRFREKRASQRDFSRS